MHAYQRVLSQSEYTLSPVGLNTECYRWYEACARGSTPVVEDVVQPRTCRGSLDIVKDELAPFIFLRDWSALPALLTETAGADKALQR